MGNRILYLLALIILTASPLNVLAQQSGTAPAEVLTLDQAISLALGDNRQVETSKPAVSKAGDALAAERTLRLPLMNVYSLFSQQFVKHGVSVDNSETNIVDRKSVV